MLLFEPLHAFDDKMFFPIVGPTAGHVCVGNSQKTLRSKQKIYIENLHFKRPHHFFLETRTIYKKSGCNFC